MFGPRAKLRARVVALAPAGVAQAATDADVARAIVTALGLPAISPSCARYKASFGWSGGWRGNGSPFAVATGPARAAYRGSARSAVSAAVAKKARSVQRVLGQAAVDLIEAAGAAAPAPTGDGRGQLISTKA